MRVWRGVLASLMCLTFRTVAAQQFAVLGGGGATFSASDFSATDTHLMAGASFSLPGIVEFRLDGVYTGVPQSHLGAISGDLVVRTTPNADVKVLPYVLLGGTLFIPSNGVNGGFNGGIGAAFKVGPSVRVFVEGRYLRILGYLSYADDLILATAGVSARL